jgi:cytochrome c oxidase cbb3-type subunit I/II
LHTNAVIFAFAGNATFAGTYYSTQRLLKTRMFSDFLSRLHFWGWQAIIVSAAVSLPLGITTSEESAEGRPADGVGSEDARPPGA